MKPTPVMMRVVQTMSAVVIVTAVVALAAVARAHDRGANLVANPGFEDHADGRATGWSTLQKGYDLVPEGRDGGWCVKCESAAGDTTLGAGQTITFAEPVQHPLLFSAWSRTTGAEGYEYSVYLDVHYADGTAAWGRNANCPRDARAVEPRGGRVHAREAGRADRGLRLVPADEGHGVVRRRVGVARAARDRRPSLPRPRPHRLQRAQHGEAARHGGGPCATSTWTGCAIDPARGPKLDWSITTNGMPFLHGDGVLLYPLPDGPAGSLRLANLRDGLEDYEYL